MSHRDAKRDRQNRIPKFWIAATSCLLVLCMLFMALFFYIDLNFDTTLPDEWEHLEHMGQSPRFYVYDFEDRANRIGEAVEVTSEVYAQQQTAYIPYSDIPQTMIDAFVAIEDKRFFEHVGVDWYRTLAAGVNYVLGFSDTFGASTITQQLVKNLTGKNEITWKRKLQEIFYAMDMERRLDKTEIMELYLNVIHFSDRCDGIGAAAEHYFSKTPQELTVAECATIAAITNSPAYYNPIHHPENNLARRNLILDEMYAQGFLSKEDYAAARAEELILNVDDLSNTEGINSWYTDMVIDDIIRDLAAEYGMSRAAASRLIYTGGLRIDMAMDPQVQTLVEEYYRTAVQVPQNADGTRAQSALIVLDSRTGDILGVAGAVGAKKGNHVQNFATQTLRPPGSTIKPLSVYAPALEKGVINWASVYDDVPTTFGNSGKRAWPKNATGVYRGLTNIPYAVAHSTNTVAVRVLQDLGLENAFRFAREKFHLSGLISEQGRTDCDLAALALGQLHYGVTLRELTAAYTAFADHGVYHSYRSYYRVLDADGKILLSNADVGETVLSDETAALMTKLLQGVITDGTSSAVTLQKLTECAGKTGTTNNDADRWFVGYTPELVCGVWCGYEYPEPLEGKNLCTGIWNTVMRELVSIGAKQTVFDVPSTLVRVSYCKDSGKLVSKACTLDPRGSRTEVGWFVVGDEPKEFCDCHVLCDYDSESGGVSHGFCPEESLKQVGLIRVERHFPMQIYVSDAQYVYRGDPAAMPPNGNPKQAYFAPELHGVCGVSNRETQYNRSCPDHTEPPPEESEEDSGFEDEFETDFPSDSEESREEELPIPWDLPVPDE